MSESTPKAPSLEQQKANVEHDAAASDALKAFYSNQIDKEITAAPEAAEAPEATPTAHGGEAGEFATTPEAEKAEIEKEAKELQKAIDAAGIPMEEAVKDEELFRQVLTNAFGTTVAAMLSPAMIDRLRTEKDLNAEVENMNSKSRGKTINDSPELLELFTGIFNEAEAKMAAEALQTKINGDDTAPASPDIDSDDDESEETYTWWEQAKARVNYRAGRIAMWPHTLMMARSTKYNERYESATPEERKKIARKAKAIGWLGTAAAAAGVISVAYMRLHGIDHSGGGVSVHTPDGHDHGSGNGHNPTDHAPALTPDQLSLNTHKEELGFLNTNGRVHNGFNNIPVDTLANNPGDKGHFPGYAALHDQYQKSPAELSAQLRQIEVIEQAKNGHLAALPQELQLRPGENHDAYIARLADAMYRDDKLHTKLTDATLDYIQTNGKPLRDITQAYSSDYIVIENGKPAVQLDQYVSSADPNDKILLLSDTKGIRFPCGQPVELLPQPQRVSTPVAAPTHYAAQTPRYETPAPVPQNPVAPPPASVPPVNVPPTTELPPTPPIDQPQIDQPPVIPAPKQTPQAFAENPFFKPMGSGNLEQQAAQVFRSFTGNGGIKEQAHTIGGAPTNASSGLQMPGAAAPDLSKILTPSNSGVSTPGGRIGNH